MFYGSCGAPPVFFEIHANAGQYIALSKWKVSELMWMHNLGFHIDALRRLGGAHVPLRVALSSLIPGESRENAN